MEYQTPVRDGTLSCRPINHSRTFCGNERKMPTFAGPIISDKGQRLLLSLRSSPNRVAVSLNVLVDGGQGRRSTPISIPVLSELRPLLIVRAVRCT